MPTYRCAFDRIGRNHNVQPLTATVLDDDLAGENLAEAVYHHARPHLGSSDVEVLVNLEEKRGLIRVGMFRPGGSFTIETVEQTEADQEALLAAVNDQFAADLAAAMGIQG